MAKGKIIFFDASIKGDSIGLGIWDSSSKKKIKIKYEKELNVIEGERLALIESLKYAQTLNTDIIHLFTDNMQLYNEGVSKALLRKYNLNFSTCKLFWIPREHNQVADALSKKAHLKKLPTPPNKHKKKPTKEKDFYVKRGLRAYSFEKKLSLIKRISNTLIQDYMVMLVEGVDNENYEFIENLIQTNENRDSRLFFQFICSIIVIGESKTLDIYCENNFKKRPKSSNKYIENQLKLLHDCL